MSKQSMEPNISIENRVADFHVRLGRLEEQIKATKQLVPPPLWMRPVAYAAAAVGLALAYYAFGKPNHYYQPMFGTLATLLLYHQRKLDYPNRWDEWILAICNVLTLTILLKFVIGGGDPQPLAWVKLPIIEGGLTDFKMGWQDISLTHTTLPLTLLQTLFLLATAFGAAIGCEIFASLTGLLVLFLAIPSLLGFNWDLVVPAVTVTAISFYLQIGGATTGNNGLPEEV